MTYRAAFEDREFPVRLEREGARRYARVGAHRYPLLLDAHRRSLRSILIGHTRVEFGWQRLARGHYEITVNGAPVEVRLQDEILARFAARRPRAEGGSSALSVRAPMPGLVVQCNVAEGARVEKGDSLLYLYAMKVENNIKAPAAGVVVRLPAAAGATVEKGDELAVLDTTR